MPPSHPTASKPSPSQASCSQPSGTASCMAPCTYTSYHPGGASEDGGRHPHPAPQQPINESGSGPSTAGRSMSQDPDPQQLADQSVRIRTLNSWPINESGSGPSTAGRSMSQDLDPQQLADQRVRIRTLNRWLINESGSGPSAAGWSMSQDPDPQQVADQ